jgi:urease accessory protein UreF
MKYLSERMLAMLERLSEMFPGGSYQSSLDAYLADKGITDAAQLENYIQQFNYSQKEKLSMKNYLNSIWGFFCAMGEANYAAHLARNGKWREAQDIAKR